MNDTNRSPRAAFIPVTGKLPALGPTNRQRVAVFLMKGNTVIAQTPVTTAGTFQLYVAPQLASEPGVSVVLGPKGADSQTLATHPDLPRIGLSSVHKQEGGGIDVNFSRLNVDDKLIDPWWIWCREYTVSGTLETAGGCPIGAQVTVYNVTCGVGGLVKTPLATVTTDSSGNFTASFNWCSRVCWWPCWPWWWSCWPWWWELDILAIIENIESRLSLAGGVANVAVASVAPLRQPSGADLMTGVGFAAGRSGTALQPDSARTALIASKFANPRIREIFPWWWWCCENPNIVFSAAQGTTTILDEDPNTSTRWCFPSGQTVTLTGNAQAVGACPVGTGGDCGFAWTSVGDMPGGVLVGDISMGYAVGSGACSNLAFDGSLNLNGVFSGGCVAYYQVLAGQWGGGGNPARGGTAPITYQQLSPTLYNYVTIWRAATMTPDTHAVLLGPFGYNSQDNLYTTLTQRQSATTPAAVIATIGAFPTLNPGDFVMGWDAPDLVLTVQAGDLVSPAPSGGANLAVIPFDVTATVIPTAVTSPPPAGEIEMGPDLTLMIDTTPLTQATIDWSQSGVFNADHTPATQTVLGDCPAYQMKAGGGYVLIHTTVVDTAGHLYEYQIQTQYGSGSYLTAIPSDRDYAQAPSSFSAAITPPPYGVDAGYGLPNNLPSPPPAPQVPPPAPGIPFVAAAPGNWTFVGGGDTTYIEITQSCCYDFQLWVGKRVTDGQTFTCTWYNPTFQTVNITVASS